MKKFDERTLTASLPYWKKMGDILGISINDALRKELTTVLNSFIIPENELDELLSTYLEKTEDVNINLVSYRNEFRNSIVTITRLMNLLPDYHAEEYKTEENRQPLGFDPGIGER